MYSGDLCGHVQDLHRAWCVTKFSVTSTVTFRGRSISNGDHLPSDLVESGTPISTDLFCVWNSFVIVQCAHVALRSAGGLLRGETSALCYKSTVFAVVKDLLTVEVASKMADGMLCSPRISSALRRHCVCPNTSNITLLGTIIALTCLPSNSNEKLRP